MPKARRQTNSRKHVSSARPLANRLEALSHSASATDKIEGSQVESVPANEILAALSQEAAEPEGPRLSKKEKQKLKHDEFVKRLENTSTPYARRKMGPNQKATPKRPLNSGMKDIAEALDGILAGSTEPPADKQLKKMGPNTQKMTSVKKKRILEEEQRRTVLVQNHPAFASNPFTTVKIHAQNTLAKHEPPVKKQSIKALLK